MSTTMRQKRQFWSVVALLLLVGGLSYLLSRRPVPSSAKPPPQRMWVTAVPAPLGSPQARTTVEVFVQQRSPCNCSYELALLGRALGELAPQRVRVRFWPTDRPEGGERLRALHAPGLAQGLAINGRGAFRVPQSQGTGGRGSHEVDFLQKERLWGLPDLYYALDQELRKQPEGKPLPLTASEFESRLSARMEQLRQTVPSDGSGGNVSPAGGHQPAESAP